MDTPSIDLTPSMPRPVNGHDPDDVFSNGSDTDPSGTYQHRLSTRLNLEPMDLSSTSSPSQLTRSIEAHLQETDRRLEDTQHLGTSLVRQREELTRKLEEVEQFQHEAQIPTDLRRRLADIEKEHADISREVARALVNPKLKQEDLTGLESSVLTSQATGSPTKVSAPNRRQRNQPSTRAGDLQFAADISTSLLAQVRQLQATVAEKDELVKRAQAEREANEQELQTYAQKIRALDESEQKYKDENWNLETQKHELLTAARDATDKEKRLNASLNATMVEKNRLQNELDDLKMHHSKLSEEHTAARKAHDTELHGLKRNANLADMDRQGLQDRIDELISQNQELAKAISNRSRSRQISPGEALLSPPEEPFERGDTPEDSPPPSPTKGTPRHGGGLESETMRSSLHHAHRMIQNLKGNIHREKTEKIELRRMLQEARDELESGRRDGGSASKRAKTKPDNFKKPARPDMLGGNRKARTDIELTDDDWEDSHQDGVNTFQTTRPTDVSDAYQTANETESNFDTADERMMTESEAFMTGAESIAGDSTDELTETEDTASKSGRKVPVRSSRLAGKSIVAHARTESSSADEHEMQTPMQPAFPKFKLRSKSSYNRALVQEGTPDSSRSISVSEDSPATVTDSPAVGEQSLYAELGGLDEINSDTHSTPARSSAMSSAQSTPGYQHTPSKSLNVPKHANFAGVKDSSTMTEPWSPQRPEGGSSSFEKSLLPSALPFAAGTLSSSVLKHDDSTQHTPQRGSAESPIRPTSSHITPPRTMWDEVHDSTPSRTDMGFSDVLSQDSLPIQSPVHRTLELQRQLDQLHEQISEKEKELDDSRAAHAAALATAAAELESLRKTHESALSNHTASTANLKDDHSKALSNLQSQLETSQAEHILNIKSKESELDQLRTTHASNMSAVMGELHQSHKDRVAGFEKLQTTISELKTQQASDIASKNSELETMRSKHASALAAHAVVLEQLRSSHTDVLSDKDKQIRDLGENHASVLNSKETQLKELETAHREALAAKDSEVAVLHEQHRAALAVKSDALDNLQTVHTSQLDQKERELHMLRGAHGAELSSRQTQLDDVLSRHTTERTDHDKAISAHKEQYQQLQEKFETSRGEHDRVLAGKEVELQGLLQSHDQEVASLRREIESQATELSARQSDLEELRRLQEVELHNLRSQISTHNDELGSRQTELSDLQAVHATEVEGLKRQLTSQMTDLSSRREEIDQLRTSHASKLAEVQTEVADHAKALKEARLELDTARDSHEVELKRLRAEIASHVEVADNRSQEHEALKAAHDKSVLDSQDQSMKHAQLIAARDLEISNLTASHAKNKSMLEEQIAAHTKSIDSSASELNALKLAHAAEMERMKAQSDTVHRHLEETASQMTRLQSEHDKAIASTRLAHDGELQVLREQISTHQQSLGTKTAELESLVSKHAGEMDGLRQQIHTHEQSLALKDSDLDQARSKHVVELESLQSQISANKLSLDRKNSELESSGSRHHAEMEKANSRIAELEQLLTQLRADHAKEIAALHAVLNSRNEELAGLRSALQAAEAQKVALPTYSGVLSQESHPATSGPIRSTSPERPLTAEKVIAGGALLGAAATHSRGKDTARLQEKNPAGSGRDKADSNVLRDITESSSRHNRSELAADQGSQTVLTSDHLDSALAGKKRTIAPIAVPQRNRSPGSGPTSPTRYSGRSSSRNRDVSPILEDSNATALPSSPPARPSSASSYRTSSLVSQQHPPLPTDHQDMIARASIQAGSPTKANAVRQSGIMGPPLMPASAMRPPRTPNESVRTASRVSNRNRRNTAGSQLSRRSSVSSFASELDERFNIRTDGQPSTVGFEAGPGTDPRMIQAITQTMIGEYLWKYTRKAGSKEMSTTRHRRYFWVHPYTKTLYWSEHDPQTAGRSELKAKSVQIESVRVVSDDNPLPPGLHRKSLEIITPGRKVKFTASTGQRHETWFNALSYLLHRGDGVEGLVEGDDTDITREDIAEFSVNGYGARLIPNDSRMSMSSYNSRTTSGTTKRVSRPTMPPSALGSSSSQTPQLATAVTQDAARQGRLDALTADRDRTIRANSITRISKMFGSMTGKTKSEVADTADRPTQKRENSSIYDASIVSDNRQEEEEAQHQHEHNGRPGLEDVRACCDGKHHVGSLHRHASSQSTTNRISNAINRSMSRRT